MGPLEKFIRPALCPLLSSGAAQVNFVQGCRHQKNGFSAFMPVACGVFVCTSCNACAVNLLCLETEQEWC